MANYDGPRQYSIPGYGAAPGYSVPTYSLPSPPQKTVYGKVRHYHKVNTEFHDALFSLGLNDRTARLSNSEFNRQVASEIGYLTKLGCAHFGKAVSGVAELIGMFTSK